jgi:hypothetical protein
MIRLILSGLWVCLVTLASTYAAVSWLAPRPPEAETQIQKLNGGLESVKTRMISVPVIGEGTIHGYVTAQFVFTVDGKAMKHLAVKPDAFLLDEAFKAIYGGDSVDFRHFTKRVSKQIGDNVNRRLGARLVEDVLVQELNYIAKDHVRGGLKN